MAQGGLEGRQVWPMGLLRGHQGSLWASPEELRSGFWQGIVQCRGAESLFNAVFSWLSDEARNKGRTQLWTFLRGAVLGMLHHILQHCSDCGLSPSTWTVALQVALPWKGVPPGSKEQDRGIPT